MRGMLNGQLVSLPEDVYDSFIFREIEAEPEVFREAEVIGRVLGKYQLGIGDGWIAARIEGMIRTGMMEPVTQPEQGIPYRRFYFDEFYPLNWAMVFSQWGFH